MINTWYAALSLKERLNIIETYNLDIAADNKAVACFENHKKLYADFYDDFMAEKIQFELGEKTYSEKNIIQAYTDYELPEFVPKPDWVIRLTEAYTTFNFLHPNRLRFQHKNATKQAFRSFFEPLFSSYIPEFEASLDKLSTQHGFSLVDKKDLPAFLEPAIEKIADMAQRAFVLELYIAKEANELVGTTPTERFYNFFEQFKETTFALNFFNIYPLLGRMAYQVCEDWKSYFFEIISNLYTDLPALQAQIPPLSKISQLTHIKALLTDGAQTGGRVVAILTFNEDIKVVYKPRDSAIDVAYGQFLVWFNAQNILPPICHAEIASYSNHSWYEFVAPNRELTYPELPVLYNKMGGLLCLMYLFGTIDMHSDNAIVVDDNPILIDLETWLQAFLPGEIRYQSVRSTHFLPETNAVVPDEVDLEGITDSDLKGKRWSESKKLVWKNEGTDDMEIIRKRKLIAKIRNGIVIEGKTVNPADYTAYITKGFRKVYRYMAAHKMAFLEASACFKHKKMRIILRGSRKYDALVEDMGHPLHLQNGIALEQFLDRLWITASIEPYLKDLIDLEKQDLIRLNNPYFYTYSDSKDLFYNNQLLKKDFFEKPALAFVADNMETMSIKDLERQVGIIRRAFAKLKTPQDVGARTL
jgi:type 2 lantibiotic biosynthesis protein LanM